jgi:hypothetical protein
MRYGDRMKQKNRHNVRESEGYEETKIRKKKDMVRRYEGKQAA